MDGLTLPPSQMQALQAEHERLLGRLDDAGGVPFPSSTPPALDKLPFEKQALIYEARAYIERSKAEAEWISDGRDRSQLRANLRFWASFILNYTGVFPDTTLHPSRSYTTEFSGYPARSPEDYETGEAGGNRPLAVDEATNLDLAELEQEDGEAEEGDDSAIEAETKRERSSWHSKVSRFFGMIAILIVGVIPLAAVCLALSLFYNLDNQSPWSSNGNAATQTATAAQLLPSSTPLASLTQESVRPPGSAGFNSVGELPLIAAHVATGQPSPEGSTCAPTLVLSLDAPEAVGNAPLPASKVTVYPAGMDTAVASADLEPGAAPVRLNLETADAAPTPQDWLIQSDHPWVGVEAVILSGALFEECTRNQVTIVYRLQGEALSWQQVAVAAPSNDLGLEWKLLTWGPQALHGQTWVAAVLLQAAGGNGNYVYYAAGDLEAPLSDDPLSSLLPMDQVVLEQELCVPAVAQAGVTSAGVSLSRALAVRLVLPECR
jgi:hypothetical protein